MKPDQLDKDFKIGDVVWVQRTSKLLIPRKKISCMLVEAVESYITGRWWKVLLDDGTLSLYRERWLEPTDNH